MGRDATSMCIDSPSASSPTAALLAASSTDTCSSVPARWRSSLFQARANAGRSSSDERTKKARWANSALPWGSREADLPFPGRSHSRKPSSNAWRRS